jgi:hypothetical protein
MDMKWYMLILFFHIHVGGEKKKEWDSYKMKVVIKKRVKNNYNKQVIIKKREII